MPCCLARTEDTSSSSGRYQEGARLLALGKHTDEEGKDKEGGMG